MGSVRPVVRKNQAKRPDRKGQRCRARRLVSSCSLYQLIGRNKRSQLHWRFTCSWPRV